MASEDTKLTRGVTLQNMDRTLDDDPDDTQLEAKTKESPRFLCSLPPLRFFITITACLLVEATLGVTYTTGNVLPYMTSYLRNATGDTSLDYNKTLWVNNTLWIIVNTLMPLLGLLARFIPHRLFLFIGFIFGAISFFGNYWAIQTSLALVVVIHGVCQGLAQAVLWPGCLSLALKWTPNRKGLVGGLVMAGYGGGAFAWNQVITQWINPNNLQADFKDGDDVYFSQPEVLEKVPTMYLLLGGLLSGIQLLCLLCLSYPKDKTKGRTSSDTARNSLVAKEGLLDETGAVEEKEQSTKEKENRKGSLKSLPEASDVEGPDYSPVQILCSRTTWTMWIFCLLSNTGLIFVFGFYKAYGQTFIRDDHLLSLVGSFSAVFNSVGRPFWGMLADRIGYLPVYLIGFGILTVIPATFIASEHAGAAMFFIWVCLMYLATGCFMCLHAPLLFRIFGGRNFTFSLGVITSSNVISSILSVFVATAVKDAFGWHGIFLLTAALHLLAFFTTASLLLNCGFPIPDHVKRALMAPKRQQSKMGASDVDEHVDQ